MFHWTFPVTKKKGNSITILRRVRKHNEEQVAHSQKWVTNQLHKYYITRQVFFIKFH
jgi:hypothetical protein